MKSNRKYRHAALSAILAICLAMTGCASRPSEKAEILIDGKAAASGQAAPGAAEGIRVIITLDGETLAELPFEEAHTIVVRQPGGIENTVRMTGSAVYMESATCKNHDCVNMGEITAENLEVRAMGGFIVCLPQKVTVEVREP